jgi:hypothetical protein
MITIKGEFTAGTDIVDAFQDATELANKLNVCVEFKFNDVKCFANPNGRIRKGAYEYHEALKSKSTLKYAHNY